MLDEGCNGRGLRWATRCVHGRGRRQTVTTRSHRCGQQAKRAIAAAACCLLVPAMTVPVLAQTDPGTSALTPDQRKIVEQSSKPSGRGELHYSGAAMDTVGAEVRVPVAGKTITIVRKNSTMQSDGSVIWLGEVQETGERALLMLWSNAVLTGYFAYNGTIYTVETLGGGVKAFSAMDRRRIPADHPEPTGRIDSIPDAPAPPPAPPPPMPEPQVEPFRDA